MAAGRNKIAITEANQGLIPLSTFKIRSEFKVIRIRIQDFVNSDSEPMYLDKKTRKNFCLLSNCFKTLKVKHS